MNNGVWIKTDRRLIFATDLAIDGSIKLGGGSKAPRYRPYKIIANNDIVLMTVDKDCAEEILSTFHNKAMLNNDNKPEILRIDKIIERRGRGEK